MWHIFYLGNLMSFFFFIKRIIFLFVLCHPVLPLSIAQLPCGLSLYFNLPELIFLFRFSWSTSNTKCHNDNPFCENSNVYDETSKTKPGQKSILVVISHIFMPLCNVPLHQFNGSSSSLILNIQYFLGICFIVLPHWVFFVLPHFM